jgi:hypothetical protein
MIRIFCWGFLQSWLKPFYSRFSDNDLSIPGWRCWSIILFLIRC